MNGEGGALQIFGVLAGTLGTWTLRKDDAGHLTFTAEGAFRAFWLSIGATRATAMAVKTQSVGRVYRPVRAQPTPIRLRFEGDIQEFTQGRVVLKNVVLMKGAD